MKHFIERSLKALRLAQNRIYRRGLRMSVAGAVEHEKALRDLHVCTVVDVGANRGQFALLACVMFGDIRIHAFEPLKEPAKLFTRLFAGNKQVTFYPFALGSRNEAATIHISGRDDSSSLLPILPRQDALYPGTKEIGSQTIEVRRGDDILADGDLQRPVLIKIDVQGFEQEVLEGMPRLLEQADYVYAEVAFQPLYESQTFAAELIDYLKMSGFRLDSIYNLSTDERGKPVYADALFVKKSSA